MSVRIVLIAAVFALGVRLEATDPLQDAEDVLNDLEHAIASGDAEAVFDRASRQVEVSIMGDVDLYSKAQALHVVRKFFDEHPPDRFMFSEDKSTAQRRFAVGLYWGRRHRTPYKVFVYLKGDDGLWELREFRIEVADEHDK